MRIADNIAVLFHLRLDAPTTDNKYPIYCRITVSQQRASFSLGMYVHRKQFAQKFEAIVGQGKEASTLNAQLQAIRNRIRDRHAEMLRNGETITAAALKTAIVGKKEKQHTLLQALKWHQQQFAQKVAAGQRAGTTMAKFDCLHNKLSAFLKWQYGHADILLCNIKESFADDFEHYLTFHDRLQMNTAMKYVRNLKKVLQLAVQKEWISRNPLQFIKCPYQQPERQVLTEAELRSLMEASMPKRRLDEVRDCFVMMCFTGFAYHDAAHLSLHNIRIMIDGQRWLSCQRTKTTTTQQVPILPVVEQLIRKYQHHPYCIAHQRLLPFKSNQKMNAYLKEIRTLCGFGQRLTTHLARHTFATTVTMANGVPMETVKELLGHQSIRTTHIYAKVLATKVSRDVEVLRRKFANTAVPPQTAAS